jgi:two-component system, chemotaxis family, chemotaxis protein CheY
MAVRSADKTAQVRAVDDEAELQAALSEGADLVLVNRVLDYGFADHGGVEMIQRLRGLYPAVKLILISNYIEAQEAAVKAGALPGFGKGDIGSPTATALLKKGLGVAT